MVVADFPSPVAVMTTGTAVALAVAVAEAVRVSVEAPVPVTPVKLGSRVEALQEAVTPDGSVPTERVTAELKDPPTVTVNASVVVAP